MKNVTKQMCEDATGCRQVGNIIYYNDSGEKITKEQALALFLKYELIEVPQAGSGSYKEVITDLGFTEVKVIDWTSSAGDWCFGAKNENGWFIVSQENRYPRHGFKYMVSDEIGGIDTFEELCSLAQ